MSQAIKTEIANIATSVAQYPKTASVVGVGTAGGSIGSLFIDNLPWIGIAIGACLSLFMLYANYMREQREKSQDKRDKELDRLAKQKLQLEIEALKNGKDT